LQSTIINIINFIIVSINKYFENFTKGLNRINNRYVKALSRGFVQGIDLIPICVEKAVNYKKGKFKYKSLTLGDKAYTDYIEDKNKNIFTISIETAGRAIGILGNGFLYCVPWGITAALDLANYYQSKKKTYKNL